MDVDIKLLECGNCEELKLGVHGTALALAVVMGAYNTAAWPMRRERHLAVNSIMYSALAFWEIQHVRHHWRAVTRRQPPRGTDAGAPATSVKAAA